MASKGFFDTGHQPACSREILMKRVALMNGYDLEVVKLVALEGQVSSREGEAMPLNADKVES